MTGQSVGVTLREQEATVPAPSLTVTRTAPPSSTRRRRTSLALAMGFTVAAAAAAFTVLGSIGALSGSSIPGLPDPGAFVNSALPATRVLLDVLGTLTVGYCLAAAFLLPGVDRTVGAAGYRLLRRAGWLALAWAVTAFTLSVFTVANFLGRPVGALSPEMVWSFLTTVALGRAYGLQVLLALVLFAGCRFALSRTLAAVLAILALITALPPAFTGHAAGAGNHQIAVTSMALHVAGAVLWLGGLAAVWAVRNAPGVAGGPPVLVTAAGRYS
nr:hypothetical protein [Longispora sp. (in: high G+C Gram-positive bacteria)]